MSKIEYFLLIPAIIYGVAIVDLLKIFKQKKKYWEVVFWGVILMEIIILNWVELFNKLDSFIGNNLNFVILIVQSILFAQLAAVITPEDQDENTESYFLKNRKLLFSLAIGVVLINTLAEYFVFEDNRFWLRMINLPLFAACLIFDKVWLRTTVGSFLLLVGAIFLFK